MVVSVIAGLPTEEDVEVWQEYGVEGVELPFLRGVPVGLAEVGVLIEGMKVSAHGPYSVDLSSPIEREREGSKEVIFRCLRALTDVGGDFFVIHAGRATEGRAAYRLILESLVNLSGVLEVDFPGITIGVEVTGRLNQFGTGDDVTSVVREVGHPQIVGVPDTSHLHARCFGGLTSEERILEELRGFGAIPYAHLSCVVHKGGEEVRHGYLNTKEPDPEQVVSALGKRNVGRIVLESPDWRRDIEDFVRLLA